MKKAGAKVGVQMCSNDRGEGEGARSRNRMVNIVFSEKIKIQKEKNKKIAKNEKVGNLESCDSRIYGHIIVISPKTAFIFLLTRYFIVSG